MYIPIDTDYFSHPKIIGLQLQFGDSATIWPQKLWFWAARHATDTGEIPRLYIEKIIGWTGTANQAADALLAAKLLESTADIGVVRVYDWHGPFRAGDWLSRYEARKVQMRSYQAERRNNRKGNSNSNSKACGDVSDTKRIHSTTPPSPPSGGTPFQEGRQAEALALTKELVDLWNHGKPDNTWVRVTPKRVTKVKARLTDKFTPEQLKKAISNARDSEWHNGGNGNGWRAPGPEWFLQSTERCEEWVHKHESKGVTPGSIEDIKRKFLGGA